MENIGYVPGKTYTKKAFYKYSELWPKKDLLPFRFVYTEEAVLM